MEEKREIGRERACQLRGGERERRRESVPCASAAKMCSITTTVRSSASNIAISASSQVDGRKRERTTNLLSLV